MLIEIHVREYGEPERCCKLPVKYLTPIPAVYDRQTESIGSSDVLYNSMQCAEFELKALRTQYQAMMSDGEYLEKCPPHFIKFSDFKETDSIHSTKLQCNLAFKRAGIPLWLVSMMFDHFPLRTGGDLRHALGLKTPSKLDELQIPLAYSNLTNPSSKQFDLKFCLSNCLVSAFRVCLIIYVQVSLLSVLICPEIKMSSPSYPVILPSDKLNELLDVENIGHPKSDFSAFKYMSESSGDEIHLFYPFKLADSTSTAFELEFSPVAL